MRLETVRNHTQLCEVQLLSSSPSPILWRNETNKKLGLISQRIHPALFLSFVNEMMQTEPLNRMERYWCQATLYISMGGRKSLLSCKTESSVSSEERLYYIKIMTFVINAVVSIENHGSAHLQCILKCFYTGISYNADFFKIKTKYSII